MEKQSFCQTIFNTLCPLLRATGSKYTESQMKKSSRTALVGPSNTKDSSSLPSTFTVTYSFTNAVDGRKRIFTQRGVPNWSIMSLETTPDSVSGAVKERSAPLRITSPRSKLLALSLRCVCGEAHYLQIGFDDLPDDILGLSSGSIETKPEKP